MPTKKIRVGLKRVEPTAPPPEPRTAPSAATQPTKIKLPETQEGTVIFKVDPLIIKQRYTIEYIHSYAEDSPFFVGLAEGRLRGSECTRCHYKYATPRAYCMECGRKTKWIDLPLAGRIHSWTTCYFGSEAFLKETPFNLVLVEFDGIDTLLLARLIGATQEQLRVGMKIRAQFRRNSKFDPTDVYFVPAEPLASGGH